jgi:biopolymer transport protein ExbD
MYNLVAKGNGQHHQSFIKKPRRRDLTFTLRLTSMIDVFTILLVFLLKSYSAEGQIMTPINDLTLPISSATKTPETSSIIVVTPELILVDGTALTTVQDVINSEGLRIENLFLDLSAKRRMSEATSNLSDKMKFKGEITIQGDANIPFEVLKKVMFTCGRVGYNNILLAVTTTAE